MFIAGTFDWASTLEQGEFLCPKCGTTKTYQRKVARTFMTLYFVPLIPISGLHEFVICRGCRQRFDTSILAGTRTGPSERFQHHRSPAPPAASKPNCYASWH